MNTPNWQKIGSKIVYKNPWIQVREDAIIRPDGKEGIIACQAFSFDQVLEMIETGEIINSITIAALMSTAMWLKRQSKPSLL